MRWKYLLPGLVLLSVIALVRFVTAQPLKGAANDENSTPSPALAESVQKVDSYFTKRWADEGLVPAKPTDDLTTLRRITLALMGTVPSLEELRAFEADSGADRLHRWTARYLHDARFGDYFAERLARSLVGIEDGQFIVYRRDRFTAWLRDQLLSNRPYPEMVRDMVAGTGLWTDEPHTNFLIAGYTDAEGFNENKLAGRAVRAFLGQRIDCAQCHDHKFVHSPHKDDRRAKDCAQCHDQSFDRWTQDEFAGLAAHFGQLKLGPIGVHDDLDLHFETIDGETLKKKTVEPSTPFGAGWKLDEVTSRKRLAEWITHPENRRFERAIVNRVWGLLFGRSWIEPVDDLPDPPGEVVVTLNAAGVKSAQTAKPADSDLLELLGADFREHGYDLRRLIEVVIASKPFLLSSQHESEDDQELDRLKTHFAIFPLTRLRPEQMIGAMLQSASIKTIDQNSHLIPRFFKFVRSRDFVNEYGDLGENELEDRAGTITQALLRMNGQLTRDALNSSPLSAPGRISGMAANDEKCLELCYLVCLTRRPTAEESAALLPMLSDKRPPGDDYSVSRGNRVEDLFWILFNSPEFAWNH